MTATAPATHPVVAGNPPAWARGWGQDKHGVFADFRVGTVEQRMRWIPPGKFLVGSPESEEDRFDWEWLQHEVELTEGFWLADTPCTQELWQEVMGENPSEYRSPRRPVERVSWEDCQRFLETLNEDQPGLELRLPTEAGWERACRAGTDTATWLGDLEILGMNNAPLLDEIAWYGGNSGLDFDLEEGFDSSGWEEKQYPHKVAGTREVGLKEPNPWGLYDMLGNVYEWCSDFWSDAYPEGPGTDPKGPGEAAPGRGAGRVFRGGSWNGHARYVRAAFRRGSHPDGRYSHLGFRLSRGQ